MDLLEFLKRAKLAPANASAASNTSSNSPIQTAADVFKSRRPDLWHLKLNCTNTNTELPYIDLVNEILESYVDYGSIDWRAANNTPTDADPNELLVNPEYTNASAYAALKSAVYPPSLPFDMPLEVSRSYLNFLGGSRDAVMKTFQRRNIPTDLAIACEYLGISSESTRVTLTTQLSANLESFLKTPIRFDAQNQQLHFWGAMTANQQTMLNSLSAYQPYLNAVMALYNMGNPGSGGGSYSTPLANFPGGNPANAALIPITYTNGQLTFTGSMNWAQQAVLLGFADDPTDRNYSAYQTAVNNLAQLSNQASNGCFSVFINSLASQTVIKGLSGSFPRQIPIKWDSPNLTFIGTMGAGQLAILATLSNDTNYQAAINQLYNFSSQAGYGAYSYPIGSLPASVTNIPSSGGAQIPRLNFNAGVLSFTGGMSPAPPRVLLDWNDDHNYQAAINNLFYMGAYPNLGEFAVALDRLVNGGNPIVMPDELAPSVAADQGSMQLLYTGSFAGAMEHNQFAG